MSDSKNASVQPTPPSRGVEAVQPVRLERPAGTPVDAKPGRDEHVAASTAGNLREAYAQFVVDRDTNDLIVRIHDAHTHEVLHELPSRETRAASAYLKNYAETLARHRAAQPNNHAL